jgi:4-diphosphocytidyl-2-C-methyl-D-erythritol kinase
MRVHTHARFRTHAKLNLFLRVFGLRSDGYHEVETILQAIDLHDELEVAATEGDVLVDMRFAPGRLGELPEPDDNLIHEAARLLSMNLDRPIGADIKVVKGIPIGAGLGGGSSNAAGALVILSELWGMDLERSDLHELAARLGSDVAYCIDGGVALATERGEKITQLAAPEVEMWFVIGGMNYPLITRSVYDAWDSLDGGRPGGPHSAPLALALGAGDLPEVGTLLHNDLERAAFSLRPELEGKKQRMASAGVLGAGMTGSGPTMFGLTDSEALARAAAARIEDDFDWVDVLAARSDCIERLD